MAEQDCIAATAQQRAVGDRSVNPPRKLTTPDIALAMELLTEGVYLYRIAEGLGVCRKTLRRTIRHAERFGISLEPSPILNAKRIRQVNERAAERMR